MNNMDLTQKRNATTRGKVVRVLNVELIFENKWLATPN